MNPSLTVDDHGGLASRAVAVMSPGLVLALGNFFTGLFTRAHLTVRTLHGPFVYPVRSLVS